MLVVLLRSSMEQRGKNEQRNENDRKCFSWGKAAAHAAHEKGILRKIFFQEL